MKDPFKKKSGKKDNAELGSNVSDSVNKIPGINFSSVSTEDKPEPSELVIKEIMVQKSVTREIAIAIIKNPS